ncbi:ABC transporter permease [Candidatus Frankia alpina]|uniref:Transport permease protein n=1 Tax=Candidatus Frankia alpina TaxID=2699483 RepID=A0A4S5ETM4_9ACTN|nr:ABC transporter permease [Candidatus Frankia alpina]THJ75877.1 ABC transporter permease [Candidatus Frankia alpina]
MTAADTLGAPSGPGPYRPAAGRTGAGLLDLRPAPAAASRARMFAAQTRLELILTLRRGESVLLTMIIPVGLLAFFTAVDVLPSGAEKSVDFLVPGVLALAVMSTAFTGQAIATGFERSYGVLKRLGATPLPRSILLAGKTAAVLAVEVIQLVLLVAVGFALGWDPAGGAGAVPSVLALLVLGTAAFSGLGLLMAGTLRAEATLAAANGVYLLLLLIGGVVFPLSKLPGWLRAIAEVLPTAALSDGLRDVLADGSGPGVRNLVVLAVWAMVTLGLAARTFRWE